MVVLRLKKLLFSAVLAVALVPMTVSASINTKAMNAKNSQQMVNLNLQYKSNNKVVKSDLLMPFYQTAELERIIGNKNVLIEINPRHGKNPDEVTLDMKFFRTAGAKAFYKKELVAKLNEVSQINVRGISLRVRPVLN